MPQDCVLTSDDLDFLQDVYDEAVIDIASIDETTMHEVVKTLVSYYRSGVRDRGMLAVIARGQLRRAAG
jgi:hypothetical protein